MGADLEIDLGGTLTDLPWTVLMVEMECLRVGVGEHRFFPVGPFWPSSLLSPRTRGFRFRG